MSMILTFHGIENKNDVHRCEDCMKIFCESMKKINFEKKEKILLTDELQESYEKRKTCCICKKIHTNLH